MTPSFIRAPWARKAGWNVLPSGCHIWTGACDREGYGLAHVPGTKRIVRAHRYRYQTEVGPIPVGMQLDHFVCGTPSCCNPAHVRPVTARENVLRSNNPASRNAAKEVCKRGHALEGENLRIRRSGRRACRMCQRMV